MEEKMERPILILYGEGMAVPRIGQAYTLTVRSAKLFRYDKETDILDTADGREKLCEILRQNATLQRPIFSFIVLNSIIDLADHGRKTLLISGHSLSKDYFFKAEISYPYGYNPPVIV